MPTPNVFPLTIVPKEDSPELTAALLQFGPTKYVNSADIFQIIQALNYLYENIGGGGGLSTLQVVLSNGSTAELDYSTGIVEITNNTFPGNKLSFNSEFVRVEDGSDLMTMFSNGFARGNGTTSVFITIEEPTGATGSGGIVFRDVADETKQVAWTDEVTSAQTAAESYADGLFDTIIGTSPETLDTLQEIANALQNNPNVISEILTSLGNRLRVDINNQGLSSTQKANALTNLGIVLSDILNRANHTGTQAISTITNLQTELNSRVKILCLVNNPSSTHTGNTSTTTLYTLPLPANTLAVGDRGVIDYQVSQTIVNAAQFNGECYINGSPAIEICRFRTSLTTHTFIGGLLAFEVLAGNLIRIKDISSTSDYGSNAVLYSTFAFNPTVYNELLFAVKLGNSANTGKIERIKVTKESL